MKALFRIDAGADIGLGHLQRCLSLALALRERGTKSAFAICGDGVAVGRARESGFEAFLLGGIAAAPDVAAALEATGGSDIAVVDSYYVGEEYLRRLRESGLFVTAVDDFAAFPFPCQLVVSAGAHAAQASYTSSSGDTTFLLGPRYAMLRPEFWGISERPHGDRVTRVLVLMGGSDPRGLTPGIVRELDRIPQAFEMTVVIGPLFANGDDVRSVAQQCAHHVMLQEAPSAVRDLMLDADVAVAAAGQTLYELAAAGTPTVAIQVAENQGLHLAALEAAGVLRAAGRAESVGLQKRVASMVTSLIEDGNARANLSIAGRKLVDGSGACAVADVVVEMVGPR